RCWRSFDAGTRAADQEDRDDEHAYAVHLRLMRHRDCVRSIRLGIPAERHRERNYPADEGPPEEYVDYDDGSRVKLVPQSGNDGWCQIEQPSEKETDLAVAGNAFAHRTGQQDSRENDP